jgi:hypothetical protein
MFSDGYNYRDAIHKLSASQQLVEIHRYASDKLCGFLVGTINNFDKDNVLLETVDEYGQKDDILNIKFEDIFLIAFQSRYLNFINKLGK